MMTNTMMPITVYNTMNQVNNIYVMQNRNDSVILFGLALIALALFLAAIS